MLSVIIIRETLILVYPILFLRKCLMLLICLITINLGKDCERLPTQPEMIRQKERKSSFRHGGTTSDSILISSSLGSVNNNGQIEKENEGSFIHFAWPRIPYWPFLSLSVLLSEGGTFAGTTCKSRSSNKDLSLFMRSELE